MPSECPCSLGRPNEFWRRCRSSARGILRRPYHQLSYRTPDANGSHVFRSTAQTPAHLLTRPEREDSAYAWRSPSQTAPSAATRDSESFALRDSRLRPCGSPGATDERRVGKEC